MSATPADDAARCIGVGTEPTTNACAAGWTSRVSDVRRFGRRALGWSLPYCQSTTNDLG